MWLIVGLGNPGPRYAGNRHNVGFLVVDELVSRHHLGAPRDKFGAQVFSGMVAGTKAIVIKPMEFMNLSGFAVQRAASFHDVELDRIVVIHDEIDLDVGRLKLKTGGGHGGHNGLRSIAEQLGESKFLRVRCGVGKPVREDGSPAFRPGDKRVSGYVLSDFPAAQRDAVDDLIRRAADATEAILARGIRDAMNEFNAKPAVETTTPAQS